MIKSPHPTTLQLLIEQYGKMQLTMDDLAEMMCMTVGSIRTAISAERFPFRTFRMGRRRVADIRDVADWIDQQRGGS